MHNNKGLDVTELIDELDKAVICGDTEKADKIAEILFKLQGGQEEDAIMPVRFPLNISTDKNHSGGHAMKPRSIKKIISIAAAAALVMALGITALATHLFGLSDMVIPASQSSSPPSSDINGTNTTDEPVSPVTDYDLIPMQGFPDSNEFKASVEWNTFCKNYDTDGKILDQVGNNSNEFTEKYPMYLVYSKEMADKLEEITAKYGLALHTSITIAENQEQLLSLAGTGDFLKGTAGGVNRVYSGYIYNDGTFSYDGQAILENSIDIEYQFANYVKGVFSEPCLNIGDADAYQEWQYTTKNGINVSLALSEKKSLVILDRENSFVIVNVLAGTGESDFGSGIIAKEDLERFSDMFDYSRIN